MDIGSVITTAVSGLGGGLLRLAPDVMKFFDRKNERKHELDLGKQQQELIVATSNTRISESNAKSDGDQALAALGALAEAQKAQAQMTGNKFVDGANMLVRPLWTYYVLLVWGTVKTVDVWQALMNDLPWMQIRTFVWGAEDASMIAALMTFWFMDRVLKKR